MEIFEISDGREKTYPIKISGLKVRLSQIFHNFIGEK
jgi:hypothetical protein